MPIMNIQTLPAAVQMKFNGKILAFEQPDNIYGLFANKHVHPAGSGDIARFEKISKLKTATVPLGVSGITPPGQTVSNLFLDAKIQLHGTWMAVHQQVTLTNDCKILNEFSKRLGVNLRETEDELLHGVLASTATSLNCVGGIAVDNPTELSSTDLDAVIRALKMASGQLISEEIPAAMKFATAPVKPAYWMLSTNDLIGNFERIAGFIPAINYSSSQNALIAEYGAYSYLRILTTSHPWAKVANASANGNDVFNNYVIAKEAYTSIEQESAGAEFIYTPANIAGGPMQLFSTCGWRTSFGGRVTNDLWCAKLRCTRLN